MGTKKWTAEDGRRLSALTRDIIRRDGGDHNIRAMAAQIERRHVNRNVLAELLPPGRRRAYAFADEDSLARFRALIHLMSASPRPSRCRLVMIIGPQASGKTHLARQMLRLLGMEEHLLDVLPEKKGALNDRLARAMRDGAVLFDNVGRIAQVDKCFCNVWGGTLAKHKSELLDARIWIIITAREGLELSADLMRRVEIIRLKGRG